MSKNSLKIIALSVIGGVIAFYLIRWFEQL